MLDSFTRIKALADEPIALHVPKRSPARRRVGCRSRLWWGMEGELARSRSDLAEEARDDPRQRLRGSAPEQTTAADSSQGVQLDWLRICAGTGNTATTDPRLTMDGSAQRQRESVGNRCSRLIARASGQVGAEQPTDPYVMASTFTTEMERMKAITFTQHGEPAKVLAVEQRPLPEPRQAEARVRILASPVNPSDLLYVRGVYAGVEARFPAPVGFEGVGMVDAVGPQVQGLAPGQRVVVVNGTGGNWAEHAVVPAGDLIPVPDDIPDEQAASFMINPASAILMLRHVLAVPNGEWLLQSAANSELGRMIIRLAKREGIHTVNVVRRHEAGVELQRLGADAVIVSTDGPIDEQVRNVVGPAGVKYAIDPVIGETGTQMYRALHEDGRMLLYGSLTGQPMLVGDDPRYILAGRRVLEVFWLGYWLPRIGETRRRQLVEEIVTLLREGTIETPPGREYSLDEIGAAVTDAESTGRQGKVFLVPEKR
jgi:NADPH:quinone reductase-like Zn-dependent oxidoreductase